jgi:hypothetical protein
MVNEQMSGHPAQSLQDPLISYALALKLLSNHCPAAMPHILGRTSPSQSIHTAHWRLSPAQDVFTSGHNRIVYRSSIFIRLAKHAGNLFPHSDQKLRIG